MVVTVYRVGMCGAGIFGGEKVLFFVVGGRVRRFLVGCGSGVWD